MVNRFRKDDILGIEQLLARAVNLLLKYTWENPNYNGVVNWELYVQIFDIKDLASGINRFYRSQRFGDEDYPYCLQQFFNAIYIKKGENLAMDFVAYVLKNELDLTDQEVINKDPDLIKELEFLNERDLLEVISSENNQILDVNNFPDDFYEELLHEINKSYLYGIYSVVFILARKFLENLIIDILRKKYGMVNIDLFYNTNYRQFHSFNVLIDEFENRLSDFRPIEPGINLDLIDKLNHFREKGNSNAHSITVNISEEEIDQDISELEHTIKVLVRCLNNIN